jgi:Xaa-Pro aminopeptidase
LKQLRFQRGPLVPPFLKWVDGKGYQIDSIIRQHLWAGGFDYPGIATGHGVSHGLGVIEGGASISSMRIADQVPFREGMVLTVGTTRISPALTSKNQGYTSPPF